jgi:hypothetical protein
MSDEDPSTMTLEFLRARLQSQRGVQSREAPSSGFGTQGFTHLKRTNPVPYLYLHRHLKGFDSGIRGFKVESKVFI